MRTRVDRFESFYRSFTVDNEYYNNIFVKFHTKICNIDNKYEL